MWNAFYQKWLSKMGQVNNTLQSLSRTCGWEESLRKHAFLHCTHVKVGEPNPLLLHLHSWREGTIGRTVWQAQCGLPWDTTLPCTTWLDTASVSEAWWTSLKLCKKGGIWGRHWQDESYLSLAIAEEFLGEMCPNRNMNFPAGVLGVHRYPWFTVPTAQEVTLLF